MNEQDAPQPTVPVAPPEESGVDGTQAQPDSAAGQAQSAPSGAPAAKAAPAEPPLRKAIRKGTRVKPKSDEQRKAEQNERAHRSRERKRKLRQEALAKALEHERQQRAAVKGLHPDDVSDDADDADVDGEDVDRTDDNDAADAVEGGQRRAKRRKRSEVRLRAAGWLRLGQTPGQGLSTGQLRDLAKLVLQFDGLPYLQEVINDPLTKDQDRLRAIDMVAKISVGYMTPDLMNADDAPELPPPIFQTTDGPVPGEEGAPLYDDAEQVEVAAGATVGAAIGAVEGLTA